MSDLAYTYYRLNVVSRWPDSALKTAVLAAITARLTAYHEPIHKVR